MPMRVVVFHGSPRKGNTYYATGIFIDELKKCGDVEISEFFADKAIPELCTGCQMCLGRPQGGCCHSAYVAPILDEIIRAHALVFTTPHHGACSMSAGMKNLMDHLDFLTMNVAPRVEIFRKKAFVLTTGAGSTAAIKPIRQALRNWGVNRVNTLGFRMFTDRWKDMPVKRQLAFEKRIRSAARRFAALPQRPPYATTILFYHVSRFIIRRFVGEQGYPYRYWTEQGLFDRRPF